MNFHLDNLKEEETPKKNTDNSTSGDNKKSNIPANKSKNIIIIGSVILGLILIVAVLGIIMTKKPSENTTQDPNATISDEQLIDENNLPLDHSGNIEKSETQLDNFTEDQFEFEVVLMDTIFKVEKAALFEGYMDGSAPKSEETLAQYVSKCYNLPDDQKTSCQKFYCAMWEGEESLSAYTFTFLKERNLCGAENYEDFGSFFNDYKDDYFAMSVNQLVKENSVNKTFVSDCKEYLRSIKRDPYTKFYTRDYQDFFLNHVEDCSRFLPEGAFDVKLDDKTGLLSFKLTIQDGTDQEGNPKTNDKSFYFHQMSDGSIYYSSSRESIRETEKINYMNRFDSTDFFYFEDTVTLGRMSKTDIPTLIASGYIWTSSNTLEKTEGNKKHKIIIKN